MSERSSGILWRSNFQSASEMPMQKDKEAENKAEIPAPQGETSVLPPSENFQSGWETSQKAEATATPESSLFNKINIRIRNIYKLTIPCSLCKQELLSSEFYAHKRQHKAMTVMAYKWTAKKKPVKHMLISQRQVLISKLLENHTYSEKSRQNIDNAWEFLCKQRIPSYHKVLGSSFKSSVHLKNTGNPLVNAIAICEDQNTAWRPVMEDRFSFQDKYGKKANVCFFGLFDGHHGSVAAETTAEELPKFLLEQLAQYDSSYKMTKREQHFVDSFDMVFKENYKKQENLFSSHERTKPPSDCEFEWIHKSFAKAFWKMDRILRLGRKEVSSFYWSGCSAIACLLQCNEEDSSTSKTTQNTEEIEMDSENKSAQAPKQRENIGVLHIANVGNVHAVLCKNGKAHLLTKEHTTKIQSERQRVFNRGGKINKNEPNGLLEGIVQITRGLGFHGNPNLRKSLIPVPQTISVRIDETCQFLIVATTGLWRVIDRNEATAIAISLFSIYEETYEYTQQEMYQSMRRRTPLLPSLSSSTTSDQDSSIKLLYRSRSAFYQRWPSLYPSSRLSMESKMEASSPTSASLDKDKDSRSKCLTEISPLRPFYLYGVEDSSETSSTSGESLRSSKAGESSNTKAGESSSTKGGESSASTSSSKEEEELDKNFYHYAAEYMSQGLVKAAITAGSRENITAWVILFSGCGRKLYRPRT